MPRFARRMTWIGKPHLLAFHAKAAAFLEPADFQFYLSLIRNAAGPAGVRILAHALLPNRVLLALVPQREDSLRHLGKRINGYYAAYLNARLGRSGSVWESGHQSCAASDAERDRLVRFVESVPVEAGLTWHAELYPWSSANGLAAVAPGLEAPVRALLRKCLETGRPFGGEAFLREAERQFGRELPRWEDDAALLPRLGPVLVKRSPANDMIPMNESQKLHRRDSGGLTVAGARVPVLLPARVSAS